MKHTWGIILSAEYLEVAKLLFYKKGFPVFFNKFKSRTLEGSSSCPEKFWCTQSFAEIIEILAHKCSCFWLLCVMSKYKVS